MPKKSSFSVVWASEKNAYELHDRTCSETEPMSENGPGWFRWLEEHDSFSFVGKQGKLTLRKEARKRGGAYWYAYRRKGNQLLKRYLGTVASLTIENLEEAATRLSYSNPVQGETQADLEVSTPQPAGTGPGGELIATVSESFSSDSLPPVLTPKLRIPRLHSNLVVRERLLSRLDAGFERKLTLVSAPAGFGKTTLVSQWIAERSSAQPLPVAWVSLDEGDNDPVRFWRYVISACESIFPQNENSSLAGLLGGSMSGKPTWHTSLIPLSEDALLTALINELSQISHRAALVLEDFHLITSQQIQAAVAKLVEHLPSTLHLILITRSDPPLPLAKLRAKNDLLELNAPELCFSHLETQEFLKQALPFQLSPVAIDRLEARTEGWGAGMRLLALALQRQGTQPEMERTLTTFSGSHRHLLEYFTSEVLEAQPRAIQDFLLKTSFLDRLTGPLCDAVTGEGNTAQLLFELERAGLFLIPLDDAGQWYRYHALFAEALEHEARFRLGEKTLSSCYLRASAWYEENGILTEAVETALLARDFQRATRLIEWFAEAPQFNERHELYTLQRWLEQLPEQALRKSPALCFLYANALVFLSFSDQVPPETMRRVENVLGLAEEGWRTAGYLPGLGEVFAFWSLLAYRQGDISRAANLSRQALVWLPDDLNFASSRVICLSITGEEERLAGQFEAARNKALEALRLSEASGNLPGKRVILYALGRLSLSKGELHPAVEYFQQVLAQAGEDVADREKALIGMARVDYEWNNLEKAAGEAREALELTVQYPDEQLIVRATLILARILFAQGEIHQAQHLLEELQTKVEASRQASLFQKIHTTQVDLLLSLGDLATARRWVTKSPLEPEGLPFLVQEEESLLSVRAWILLEEFHQAEQILGLLLDQAQKSDHTRMILEILLLKTFISAASKKVQLAKDILREALPSAYQNHYQRLFLERGEEIRGVLKAMLPEIQEKHLADYIRTLLRAFSREEEKDQRLDTEPALVEPLSAQELRILRLLDAGLSRQEIAQELVISVNTVKTHLQHIFQKLNVSSRSEAIQVARHLLPR